MSSDDQQSQDKKPVGASGFPEYEIQNPDSRLEADISMLNDRLEDECQYRNKLREELAAEKARNQELQELNNELVQKLLDFRSGVEEIAEDCQKIGKRFKENGWESKKPSE